MWIGGIYLRKSGVSPAYPSPSTKCVPSTRAPEKEKWQHEQNVNRTRTRNGPARTKIKFIVRLICGFFPLVTRDFEKRMVKYRIKTLAFRMPG